MASSQCPEYELLLLVESVTKPADAKLLYLSKRSRVCPQLKHDTKEDRWGFRLALVLWCEDWAGRLGHIES